MSTETTPAIEAAPAAPAVETAPVTTTPAAAPSEADVSAAMEAMGELTSAQLDAMGSGDFSGITLTPKDDKPTESKPAESAPAAPTAPSAAEKVHRLSLGGLKPESRAKMVEFKSLVTGGMDEAEAAAKVFGVAAAPAVTTAPAEAEGAPPKDEPAAPPPALQELQDKVAAKQAEIKAIRDEFGDATELIEQLQDLKLDLRDAQREHQSSSAAAAAMQTQVNASLQRVMAEFSELWSDPKANFESLCDDEFVLAQHKNDPVLAQPDWPEQIAKKVKEKFFKRYDVDNAGDNEDDPQIPPLPDQKVRLPGSLTGQTSVPGSFTEGGILAAFDSLTREQQDAVLDRM